MFEGNVSFKKLREQYKAMEYDKFAVDDNKYIGNCRYIYIPIGNCIIHDISPRAEHIAMHVACWNYCA